MSIFGGTPPYEIKWEGMSGFNYSIADINIPNIGEDISNLVPDLYQVTVTEHQCGTSTLSVNINCGELDIKLIQI